MCVCVWGGGCRRGGRDKLETAVISDHEVRQGSVCVGGGGRRGGCGGGDLETAVCSGVAVVYGHLQQGICC